MGLQFTRYHIQRTPTILFSDTISIPTRVREPYSTIIPVSYAKAGHAGTKTEPQISFPSRLSTQPPSISTSLISHSRGRKRILTFPPKPFLKSFFFLFSFSLGLRMRRLLEIRCPPSLPPRHRHHHHRKQSKLNQPVTSPHSACMDRYGMLYSNMCEYAAQSARVPPSSSWKN